MIKFRPMTSDDLEMVGSWRSQPRINAVMNTHYDYDPEKQAAWFKRLLWNGMINYHWIILDDERPVGLINLADFQPDLGKTSWGFYIGETDFKFGSIVPAYLYNHLFLDNLLIDKITAEVRNNNQGVIKLHLSMGYTIDNVGSESTNMVLLRSTWLNKQKKWHNLSRELK